jgi:hypothetical protein
MPGLLADGLPKSIAAGLKYQVHEAVWNWLWHAQHVFLEHSWKPFFLKDIEKNGQKLETGRQAPKEADNIYRVQFFGVSGRDLKIASNPFQSRWEIQRHLCHVYVRRRP